MAKDVTLNATGVRSIIAKIQCEYNATNDTDDYYITLIESYPGGSLWLGEQKIHYKGAWYDKYGGFALSKFNVKASLTKLSSNAALESVDITNTHNNEKDGLTHRYEKENNTLNFIFTVKTPLKYSSHRALNGTVNDYSKIFTKKFSVEESWHLRLFNSSKQEQNMVLVADTEYFITSGAASSGIGANHDYNICKQYNINNEFELPLPDRYKDGILLTFYLRSGNAGVSTDVLFANSPTLKSLYNEGMRTALNRKRLIHSLSKEWQKVYDELKNANLSLQGLNDDLIMSLRMSDFEDIHIGENEFTKICVNKNGEVSME